MGLHADPWTVASLTLSLLGLAQAACMLLHALEHRRFHRSRQFASPGHIEATERVLLCVPCKGTDVQMEGNLRALFIQHHRNYELCFVLESESEPAVPIIRRLGERFPVPYRLVFAGRATDCGQKVHNLMCATCDLEPRIQVLAFVDSDACPPEQWLGRLVARLRSGKYAVSTGYRWFRPQQATGSNLLLSAINGLVSALMGPHGFNLVWGGAWAIPVETFHSLGLPDAWSGTLSDDLLVSRLVRAAGGRVAYDPHCLVSSPLDITWRGVFEFLKRQYVVVRVYAPTWWRGALAAGLFTNCVFGGLLALASVQLLTGRSSVWTWTGLAAFYLLTCLRLALAHGAIRPFVQASETEYRRVARVGIWGWPAVSLANTAALLAAGTTRTICWRGIGYRLDSPSHTTVLGRTDVAGPPAALGASDHSAAA